MNCSHYFSLIQDGIIEFRNLRGATPLLLANRTPLKKFVTYLFVSRGETLFIDTFSMNFRILLNITGTIGDALKFYHVQKWTACVRGTIQHLFHILERWLTESYDTKLRKLVQLNEKVDVRGQWERVMAQSKQAFVSHIFYTFVETSPNGQNP